MRDAAVRGDWPALVQAYKAADDWPVRNAVVRTAAETRGIENLLQQVVNSEPDNVVVTPDKRRVYLTVCDTILMLDTGG